MWIHAQKSDIFSIGIDIVTEGWILIFDLELDTIENNKKFNAVR